MIPDGTMSEEARQYAGLDRYEARRRIVADLEELGLLECIEDHSHSVGHCSRCNSTIEPLISVQWFVRMEPLADKALQAVRSGEVRFVPERWAKVGRLVHLAPALVGASNPCVALR